MRRTTILFLSILSAILASCATGVDTKRAHIEKAQTGHNEFVLRQVHSLMVHDIGALFGNNSYVIELHIPMENIAGKFDLAPIGVYEVEVFDDKSSRRRKLTNVSGYISINAESVAVQMQASWPWANSPVRPSEFNGTYKIARNP